MMLTRQVSALVVVTTSLLTLASGCQTLTLGNLTGADSLPNAATSPGEKGPTYTVQYHPSEGRPEKVEVPWEEGVCLQDALVRAEALKRFRRANVELYRKPPDQELYCRMEVHYERSKRAIPPLYNYAVHPGDRLVVTEDPSDAVDDMLDSLKSPFSHILPN